MLVACSSTSTIGLYAAHADLFASQRGGSHAPDLQASPEHKSSPIGLEFKKELVLHVLRESIRKLAPCSMRPCRQHRSPLDQLLGC